MILISEFDISHLAEKHYKFVSSDVNGILDFYLDIFNSIGNRKYIDASDDINKKYSLHTNSLFSIINHLLDPGFKKVVQTPKINKNDIEDILKRGVILKINNSLDSTEAKKIHDFFVNVKSNIKNIIVSKPEQLNHYITKGTFNNQTNAIEKECIENIFSYEDFTKNGFYLGSDKWDSYALTSALGLSVCTYCNRNWIITINDENSGKKIANPQLDHYLCKAEHPLFRLSFYNLIPSCDTCNVRLKKGVVFKYDENLNPHEDSYDKKAFFKTIAKNFESSTGAANDFEVFLEFGLVSEKTKTKILNNHKTFEINQVYEKHGDLISELYGIKYKYNETYLGTLKTSFKEHNWSDEEIYKLAFGNYYNESDFKKRPFAKFTKDIASQLGLIK